MMNLWQYNFSFAGEHSILSEEKKEISIHLLFIRSSAYRGINIKNGICGYYLSMTIFAINCVGELIDYAASSLVLMIEGFIFENHGNHFLQKAVESTISQLVINQFDINHSEYGHIITNRA